MKIKICDKCGVKMFENPMQQTMLPLFSISAWYGCNDFRDIDLCAKCQKAFEKWLNTESEDD